MVNLIKINKHGELFITPYETADAAKETIKKATNNAPMTVSQNKPGCTIISCENSDTTYIITNSNYVTLTVNVPDGKLMANSVLDSLYPGLDIEYIADNEDENTDVLTRPRVLIEKPRENKILSAMLWNDKNSEDYSHKIVFEE